ncbi:blocked early in transport 1 [Vigna unguiculata]|uniref:Blocked early in transport 1 n=1 Tax=Vigna unguiculata TaxID=3917 RepID=A0A4D6N264_VIGUN|nr:blocked early in transport 1 [Vigna unguiculata]
MNARRDGRNNRVALFDGIEEGGIRASSLYSTSSHEIDEHDNEQALEGLQDRVNLLKRLSGDINEEVDSHNRMLDRMGNDMDSSRGVLSGTMDKFKMSNSTDLPARSQTQVIEQLRTSTLAVTIKSMNVPAHDIVKHLLVQAQHHKHAKHKPIEHTALYAIAWRCLSTKTRYSSTDRLTKLSRRQAVHHQSRKTTHDSCIAWRAFNASRRFLKKFQKCENQVNFDQAQASQLRVVSTLTAQCEVNDNYRCGSSMKMEARVSCVRWRKMMTWQCMVGQFSKWRIMTRVIIWFDRFGSSLLHSILTVHSPISYSSHYAAMLRSCLYSIIDEIHYQLIILPIKTCHTKFQPTSQFAHIDNLQPGTIQHHYQVLGVRFTEVVTQQPTLSSFTLESPQCHEIQIVIRSIAKPMQTRALFMQLHRNTECWTIVTITTHSREANGKLHEPPQGKKPYATPSSYLHA